MFKQLAQRIFCRSRGHLTRFEQFYLSKFVTPRDPADTSEFVKAILQEDPVKIARRLVRAGLLEKASKLASLNAATRQADLKQALRAAGLKVSGKKEELVQRLIENRPELAAELSQQDFLVLSKIGTEAVASFLRDEQAHQDALSAEWLRCYSKRDLNGVLAASRKYHKWKIQPPIGFNPGAIDLPDQDMLDMLECIVKVRPSILGNISQDNLNYLRRCAAWNWASAAGCGSSKQFALPADFECRLAAETAVRMVDFAAKHRRDLRKFQHIGIHEVRITTVGLNAGCCSYCQSFEGKMFSLEAVPELPHANCTNSTGCRCWMTPIVPGLTS